MPPIPGRGRGSCAQSQSQAADGDGYETPEDWDDGDAEVHPGALETCDEEDDDCDGVVDDGLDLDGEGYSTCAHDCADDDPAVHPGALETCDNGVDDDCHGSASGCNTEGTIPLESVTVRLVGEDSDDYAGYSVASAGDVNADGHADVLVRDYHESTGGGYAGMAWVVHGGMRL